MLKSVLHLIKYKAPPAARESNEVTGTLKFDVFIIAPETAGV